MPLTPEMLRNMNPRYHVAVALLADSRTMGPRTPERAAALAEAQLEATLALLENQTVTRGGVK